MKKGLGKLIVGVLLMIAAVIIPSVLTIIQVAGMMGGEQFKVPGSKTFRTEPGIYMLWNDHRTVFEGQSYTQSESLPTGVMIKVTDSAGNELYLVPSANVSFESGSTESKGIGTVTVKDQTDITITVSDLDEDRIFSFGKFKLETFDYIMGAWCLALPLGVAGLVLLIIGIVQLASSKPVGPQV